MNFLHNNTSYLGCSNEKPVSANSLSTTFTNEAPVQLQTESGNFKILSLSLFTGPLAGYFGGNPSNTGTPLVIDASATDCATVHAVQEKGAAVAHEFGPSFLVQGQRDTFLLRYRTLE